MSNDPKDRHVLAAAVRCGAEAIVTYNKRHFPSTSLEPWGVEVQAPGTFLKHQYDLNPAVVIDKLHAQAQNLGRTLPQQLTVLRRAVSAFVDIVCEDLDIKLDS